MLPKPFSTAAKAALILAGAGFGLLRGLRLLDGLADHSDAVRELEERIDGMQGEIAALRTKDEQLQARLDGAVTHDGLAAALDQAFDRIQTGIDMRFENQARSVEALRAMVGQTDELLDRLLDRLESLRNEAELQQLATENEKARAAFAGPA